MRSAKIVALVAVLALSACLVSADVYMHHPRGGNDRLNEGGPGRNNGDRLWDSQNNNRGGYNVGSLQRIYYYEGTVVPVEWTQQHSCGDVNGNACELIIQYSCGDSRVRDGQTTNTIPTDNSRCSTTTCDEDQTYGRHESQASYMACRYRSRNKGLFLGTQRMRGNSARFTRQNNDGSRSGYECPEERDYYPNWHPSVWRDVAIITNRPERCAAYKAQSQNVVGRGFCQWDVNSPVIQARMAAIDSNEGFVPITKAACEDKTNPKFPGGVWVEVPSFGIAAPDCVEAPFTRDNHLGNAVAASAGGDTNGYTAQYNWTVPYGIDSPNCILRLRYNISTGEFPSQGFASDTLLDSSSATDASQNVVPLFGDDNNGRFPAEYPIWTKYGMTRTENAASFTKIVQNDDPNNDNNGRQGGIKKALSVTGQSSRDYTFRNNPQVDIFGSLLNLNQSLGVYTVDAATQAKIFTFAGQPMIRTRLAINTAQYGRTFEDRTHVFEIRARPASLQNSKIHNLSVRGKRGNIVQVYPGVEYDFVPDRLHMDQGDLVHIQWTGSGPQDGEGSGNLGDRSNVVLLRDRNYVEFGQDVTGISGQWGNSYPSMINDTNVKTFLGFDLTLTRMLAIYGINSTHFDLGPQQVRTTGQFKYMCTRNNAFSNRSQKGVIVVAPNAPWVAAGSPGVSVPNAVSMYGWTESSGGKAKLTQSVQNPGVLSVAGDVNIVEAPKVGANWYQVNPRMADIGVGKDELWLTADRPQPGNFFMKGQLLWKLNPEDQAVELIPTSGFYSSQNKISITQGGYYKSTAVPNTAMIAGIILGGLGIIAIVLYLYWRVRVQPEGGWKAFWNKDKSVSNYSNAELAAPGEAASSSGPRV